MKINGYKFSFGNRLLTIVFCFLFTGLLCYGQSIPVPKLNLGIDTAKTPEEVGSSLQLLALLTILSVAPSIIILTTAFTRIIIVLSFIRQALGTQGIPPQQVVTGLSVILTLYVMAPTYSEVHQVALKPYFEKKIGIDKAFDELQAPLKRFMLKNTYEKELNLILNIGGERVNREDVSIFTVIPAFILSELKTAFVIGFYIFIPLLIIDLVVASSMMSMGMMMMPPTVVALPVKILIFALADGWSVLISSLLSGYF